MSLLTTTVYAAPVWRMFGFDYLTGSIFGGGSNSAILLPDFFNKHTLWLAHFQYPFGLLATPVITSGLRGFGLLATNGKDGTDFPLYFFRPPSSNDPAGTLSAAGLTGPGLLSDQTLQMQYTYGIGGGASGLANIVGSFAYDTMLTLPLGTVTAAPNIIDHFAPGCMTHCSIGGTNIAPSSTTVGNMGICTPIEIDFVANQFQLSCPNISALITPTLGQPYWAYGFGLIRSEQV